MSEAYGKIQSSSSGDAETDSETWPEPLLQIYKAFYLAKVIRLPVDILKLKKDVEDWRIAHPDVLEK